MVHTLGGKVRPAAKREYGRAEIDIVSDSVLFQGLAKKLAVWISHGDEALQLPPGFELMAKTHYAVAGIQNTAKRCYATSPTNLYSQHYFPSLDFTLSFHIGVMLRVSALQRGAPNRVHKSRFTPVWRRWEQAAQSYDEAKEAEDFQAVGMRCRETFIQFVRVLAKPEMVPAGEDAPKRANVVGWSSLIANNIAPGDRNSYVRGHLKAIAKSAWDLANWLTHQGGAIRPDAEIVLDATQGVIDTFGTAVMRHESGAPEECPECGSYSIDVGFEPELKPNPYILECENCGWQKQQDQAHLPPAEHHLGDSH